MNPPKKKYVQGVWAGNQFTCYWTGKRWMREVYSFRYDPVPPPESWKEFERYSHSGRPM